jgi:hypothetical protein
MREDVLREYMTPIPLCYVALGDGPLVPKDNIDVNAMADRIAELEARIETIRLTGTTTVTPPSIPTTASGTPYPGVTIRATTAQGDT